MCCKCARWAVPAWLDGARRERGEKQMKYVFIVNPVSGHKDKEAIFSRIRSAFRLLDDEMIVEETDIPATPERLQRLMRQSMAIVVSLSAVAATGTVHEIANGLAHTETPMMLLPLGTGNDFAKKVYGTKKINVENVIKSFGLYSGKLNYTVEPLDLIDYNGEKCINVMSYGLDTKVETIGRKIAGKIPPLGHQAYNIAVVPVMMQPLRYKVNVELDCVDENGNPYKFHRENMEYALFAICNASYYGGGFCPAPAASWMTVCWILLCGSAEPGEGCAHCAAVQCRHGCRVCAGCGAYRLHRRRSLLVRGRSAAFG